jgi:integrase
MYIFSLDKYMLHHGIKTIDDLLENRHNPSKIEEQIIDWIVFLRTGGGGDPATNNNNFIASLRTRQLYLAAILAFYEINDVVLRKKKIAKFLGSEEEGTIKKHKKDRAYTTEEIRKLLDHADIRSKVIVLLLATTGMRLGALSELKLKHLKKIPEYNIYQVTVYENTKDEHYTFCTSECAKAIDDYLQYRRKCGERIDVEEGNARVIRERFDRIDIEITKKPAESITTGGIGEILDVLLARAGLT